MSTTDVVEAEFEVTGPLPTGTVVLEASAGTGKTFTIAALATRYVAEGVAELPRMMLVTFGRWATAELRDRVRARLVSAERLLRADDARASADPLVAHLADVDDDELARRRDRLTHAVAQFDAATIATTHGFCQQMLAGLGIIGDGDLDTVFVPDVEDLREEVVDDLYLQRYATLPAPPLTVEEARRLGKVAVGDRQAQLVPTDAADGSVAAERLSFAGAVRAEVLRRKRSGQIQDYDDLLFQLRDALVHEVTGAHAVERVRSTYDVVLVDEFQDTDPVQWEILRTAFHGHRTLVLIGDPKQAIYAFRGADVDAYLDATRAAGTRATLATNHRSDEPLLAALGQVLAGVALGNDEIVVHPVRSAHPGRRLTGGAPLRLRVVPREAVDDPNPTAGGMPRVGPVRELVARDVAADVVRQLSGGAVLTGGSTDGATRSLTPGDVAVVTQTNAQAGAVLTALRGAGVPAVQSGFQSVFGTPAAGHWLTLLTALEQPTRSTLVGAAALTPFVGWTAEQLARAGDAERDELTGRVRRWSRLQTERGVAALLEVITADGLAARLLRQPSGERTMTDVRHVGQTLHEAAVSFDLGTAATAEWLRARIKDVARDYVDERSRRLESDADAVQVLTVHASKGLEYPVVHVPFAWDRWDNDKPDALLLHQGGRRLLDVGGRTGPGYGARKVQHDTEDRDEDLRVLYVALTRARSQVVLWWAPSTNGSTSPLTRLLFAGTFPGTTPGQKVAVPSDAQAWSRAVSLAAGSDGTIEAERVTPVTDLVWQPSATPAPRLEAARFGRTLDADWARTSYTGLTRSVHDAAHAAAPGVGSEPESAGTDDEADVTTVLGPGVGRDDAVPSPMADLPGGAAFGTLVHGVLEHVDTGAADLGAELRRLCEAATSVKGTGVDAETLATGLEPVLRTPLGPLASGLSLADVPVSDRLSEMAFELPLAGGDDAVRVASTLATVAAVLRRWLAADDPLVGYAAMLEAEPLGEQVLRGYLTGSLDAVLRVPGPAGPRYVVADYKTNWLGAADEPLTTWHYRPEALVSAMLEAHYPLQVLLYLVALHRFLRWRQPAYDPESHLGGGLYLFVRGMAGPDTPLTGGVPAGVFAWRPPAALVVELSAVLDGAPGSTPTGRGTA